MDKFKAFVKEHLWATILVVAGIVLTILLLTIGFFKTLLLAAIVAACLFIGNKLEVHISYGNRYQKVRLVVHDIGIVGRAVIVGNVLQIAHILSLMVKRECTILRLKQKLIYLA